MIYLVHGIRAFDPADTMGGLKERLKARGHESEYVDYGYILFPITNGKGKRAARRTMKPGCTMVGYSNGAAIVHAVCNDLWVKHVVLISPALPRDVKWPISVETVTVFYSKGDIAVKWGGRWAWLANRMPWRWGSARDHPWGDMGLKGPIQGKSRKISSYMMGKDVSHSWFSYPEKVDMIAARVANLQNYGRAFKS